MRRNVSNGEHERRPAPAMPASGNTSAIICAPSGRIINYLNIELFAEIPARLYARQAGVSPKIEYTKPFPRLGSQRKLRPAGPPRAKTKRSRRICDRISKSRPINYFREYLKFPEIS